MSLSFPHGLKLLERQESAFLSTLHSWTPNELGVRPAPGAWSAMDVLDHITKVEYEAFARMQENLNQSIRVPLADRLRGTLIIQFMRAPVRVRVPAAVAAAVLPGNSASLPTLTSEWTNSQSQLEEWLGRLEKDPRSLAGFRHPVSGWMTVSQGLSFLAAHVQHHRFQLARIKRQLARK